MCDVQRDFVPPLSLRRGGNGQLARLRLLGRQCQAQRQQQLALPTFTIELGAINRFASALYVEVHDREHGLDRIRQALQDVMPE